MMFPVSVEVSTQHLAARMAFGLPAVGGKV